MRARLPVLLALALGLAACDEREFFVPQDVDVVVVDAVLTVDRALPPVLVSRTLAPEVPFSPLAAGERDATVWIELDDGTRFDYTASLLEPGRYLPQDVDHRVLPATRYALRIETARAEVVTAETLTPPRLDIDQWLLLDATGTSEIGRLRSFEEVGDDVFTVAENRLVWGDGLLEARFDRVPSVPAYQVAISSLDLDSPFVIDPDFFEEEDFDDIDRDGTSPMFEAIEGTIRMPWFAVFFEGRYLVRIHATDRNWHDLVRSSPSLNQSGGFGGNAGDDFGRPLFHVEGGIGLFGSSAVDSIGFFVLPRE